MPNLKVLWIHSNQIQTIDPNAFSRLSKLEHLNISHNPLTELPEKVCAFIRSVPKVHTNGLDMNTLCPSN